VRPSQGCAFVYKLFFFNKQEASVSDSFHKKTSKIALTALWKAAFMPPRLNKKSLTKKAQTTHDFSWL
jgi:hypothetical protein